MVAAYLLDHAWTFPTSCRRLFIGMIVAAAVGYLIGLIALRRTGIYFAMITVAIAEVFYFVEFNPLSAYTGGENGLPGVPTPTLYLGFTTVKFNTDRSLYAFLAFCYFVGIVTRAAHRALAGRRHPVARSATIRCAPPLSATISRATSSPPSSSPPPMPALPAACSGVMQGFMPPDAFTFDTSGQLVMQTAIGGAGTLFGPLVGATVWLYLSDFFQTTLHLGATWKLVLGVVFVLLVCFLRRGIVGGIQDLYALGDQQERAGGRSEWRGAGHGWRCRVAANSAAGRGQARGRRRGDAAPDAATATKDRSCRRAL